MSMVVHGKGVKMMSRSLGSTVVWSAMIVVMAVSALLLGDEPIRLEIVAMSMS